MKSPTVRPSLFPLQSQTDATPGCRFNRLKNRLKNRLNRHPVSRPLIREAHPAAFRFHCDEKLNDAEEEEGNNLTSRGRRLWQRGAPPPAAGHETSHTYSQFPNYTVQFRKRKREGREGGGGGGGGRSFAWRRQPLGFAWLARLANSPVPI